MAHLPTCECYNTQKPTDRTRWDGRRGIAHFCMHAHSIFCGIHRHFINDDLTVHLAHKQQLTKNSTDCHAGHCLQITVSSSATLFLWYMVSWAAMNTVVLIPSQFLFLFMHFLFKYCATPSFNTLFLVKLDATFMKS